MVKVAKMYPLGTELKVSQKRINKGLVSHNIIYKNRLKLAKDMG